MSKVVHLNFQTRRRVTVLPPADPTYYSGNGFEVEAKPGCVELTFEKPHNRWSVSKVKAFIEKLEDMVLSAELQAEDAGG